LACNIAKKRDINDCSFAHLTLILLLHYLEKCSSHSLDVYNNESIVGTTCRETTKSLKICYLLNISQERVYRTKISDVNELKRCINSEWGALSHTVIECSVWRVA